MLQRDAVCQGIPLFMRHCDAGHKVSENLEVTVYAYLGIERKPPSKGCLACEYCHTKGNGACVQKDDMQEVYSLLGEADMLVIASPIYYHGVSGQLKCALDRFYSAAYPRKPRNLKKVAMILSSGDLKMYDGAMFSYKYVLTKSICVFRF